MATLTLKQTRMRFATLPPSLQSAIFSVQNSEIIGTIIEQNNVPDDKAEGIPEEIGLVLLGFIHPEELAERISEKTGLPPGTAKAISDSVAARIFKPLGDVLDQSYAPAPHPEEETESPGTMEEIKRPSAINIGEAFVSPKPIFSATLPSRAREAEAVENEPLGEFERKELERKIPPTMFTEPVARGNEEVSRRRDLGVRAPATTEQPAASDAEPPPTIIHREDSGAKPLRSSSEFKIDIPIPKISEIKKEPAPLRQAVIEIGGLAPRTPPAPPRPQIFPAKTTENVPTQKEPSAASSPTMIGVDTMKPLKELSPPEKIPTLPMPPKNMQADRPPAVSGAEPPAGTIKAMANIPVGPRVVHYTELKTALPKTIAPDTAAKEIPRATPLVGYEENSKMKNQNEK